MTESQQKQRMYEKHIIHQKQGFEITAKFIGYIIQRMQEEGIISTNVEVTGRIKSYQSANANSEKKILDDCFGIRIIGSASDLAKIRAQLERILVTDKVKDHSKDNREYNAIHQMAHLQRKYAEENSLDYDKFPIVEIQYWTPQLREMCEKGKLSYSHYKKTAFEHIKMELKEHPNTAMDSLPTYYEIRGNHIKQLSICETFDKLYPDLDETDK